MKLFIWLYRKIFCRTSLFTWNQRVMDLMLRGVGVLNYEGYAVSGEAWLLEHIVKQGTVKTIVDVGANTDPYGVGIPGVTVYALEPNKKTFARLRKDTKHLQNIHVFPIGLSDKPGKATIYDISTKGTALASLDKKTVETMYGKRAVGSEITLSTLDAFVKEQQIASIDVLKIDTEGNEYQVLLGAKQTLARKKIKYIVFEFNEMHAYRRVFLRDFYDLLPGYTFYRLLPDGLGKLGPYRPITHELFAFQNIVAIREDL